MTLPDACTYLLDDGESRCNRQPVVIDAFEFDELTGSHWLVSLCSRHWSRRARAFAVARGYIWTDRETGLTAVQGGVA